MAVRDLILLLIIVASVPLILYRPWVGILLWYWIGIMNPHRLTWGFMQDFPVAQLVAVMTLGALLIARDRQSLPVTKEVVLMVAMAGFFTVTTTQAWVSWAAWDYWEQVMKMFLITLITPILIYGRQRVEWLMIVVAGSMAFYGIKGGLFTLGTGGSFHVLGPARSFIEGNTALGLAMLMGMPLMLVLARQASEQRLACLPSPKWSWWAGWLGYAAFWLTGLATIFTHSRGAWLGLAVIAPFIFLKMRYKALLATIVVVAVMIVGVTVPEQIVNRAETIQTYEEDWSAMQRIQAWGVSWNVALENPLTGAGFEMVRMGDELWLSYANFMGEWPNQARAAHSNYFQVLGQHGFVGLGLYLALLIAVTLSLMRLAVRARRHEATRWISEYAWALMVGVVGYAVAGAFLDLAYFTMFYAFVALTIVLRREFAWAGIDARAPVRAQRAPPSMTPEQA